MGTYDSEVGPPENDLANSSLKESPSVTADETHAQSEGEEAKSTSVDQNRLGGSIIGSLRKDGGVIYRFHGFYSPESGFQNPSIALRGLDQVIAS